MESSFSLFLRLGIEHISDLNGYDHMLFITALCAVYQFNQWKHLLWLVTAFTLGHSVTLALATLDLIVINGELVEFLIPITIFVTSLVNIVLELRGHHSRLAEQRSEYTKYGLALGFGLIHGMGFSNFLRAMLGGEESIVAPLFAFNIGLELGQIMILAAVLLISTAMVRWVGLAQRDWSLLLSGGTAGAALIMIVDAL
jgi:HupE / UreJ protein